MNKNDLRTAFIALLCSIIVVGFYHFGMGVYRMFREDCPYPCGKPVFVHIVGFGPRCEQRCSKKHHFRGRQHRGQMMPNGGVPCPAMQQGCPFNPMMQYGCPVQGAVKCPAGKTGNPPKCGMPCRPGMQGVPQPCQGKDAPKPDARLQKDGGKPVPPAPEGKAKPSLGISEIYGDEEA